MKQIVDKLNKIAKKIDDSVELPATDLITDSLDAITKALGGTPNDSNLIVDKLEDIAGVATKGGEGEDSFAYCTITIINTSESTGNLHLSLSEQCVVLSQYMDAPLIPAGTIIPLQQTIVIQPNIPRVIRALYVDYGNNQRGVAYGGLWGRSEDYSSILTNLNNVTVQIFPDQEQTNLYHYMLVVTDTTKPSSVTYTQELGLI